MKGEFLKTLGVILAGPILALIFGSFGLVLAPPNQGFSSLGYFPICGLALPISIALFIRNRLLGQKFWFAMFISLFLLCILFLAILPASLTLPSAMSTCNIIEPANTTVRYECVDSSSDNGIYHREFIIVGFKDWPIMRAINK